MAEIRHLFTKVVGVTKNNRDGKSRQKVIARCRPLEKLKLENEDDNPVDPNAVAVLRQDGQQLGYLKAELAEEVVRHSQQGYRYGVYITQITGGDSGKETCGVNLLVVIGEPGVSDRKVQTYVDALAKDSSIVGRQTTRQPTQEPTKKKGCLLWLVMILVALCWIGFKMAR